MRSLVLVLLAGCSDYELNKAPDDAHPGGTPQARVDGLDGWHCGDGLAGEAIIANDGTADLTVIAIDVEGDWSATLPSLPLELGPGDQVAVPVMGDGEGRIVVHSDDPVNAELSGGLSADLDEPPTLEVLSPTLDETLGQGASVVLEARVTDDHDPVESMWVSWRSNVDGTIGSTISDVEGLSTLTWSDRSPGPHALRAQVLDSCGNPAIVDLGVCQQGGYTEEELDIAGWHFEGWANWDTTNDWLELTPVAQYTVGSAFQTDFVTTGNDVEIGFDFYIGDGTGADGISLTALDLDRYTTFLGGWGCGIGYGGDAGCTDGPALPGWSIEVDTYYNEGQDPTAADHLMLTFDGDVDDPAAWVELPEMEDNGWHTLDIAVSAPHVTVQVDGVTYIDTDVGGHFDFPAYVGFTAGTGGSTNTHRIDSLVVEEQICP